MTQIDQGALERSSVEIWSETVRRFFREGEPALSAFLALYDERFRFQDPLRVISGLPAFATYNMAFVRKAREVDIEFGDMIEGERAAFASWTMRVVPRVGPEARVEGVTELEIEARKIVFQRDYFDVAGAVPVLGGVLRTLMRAAGV